MDIKDMGLIGAELVQGAHDLLRDALNAVAVEVVESAMGNIAKQVRVLATCDGKTTVFLMPTDCDGAKDECVDVECDCEGMLVTVDVAAAIKEFVDATIKTEHREYWPSHRQELIELSSKIKALADLLS